ncbi:MAG: DNA replication/repair protein RecF [Clostridiales bacterium]
MILKSLTLTNFRNYKSLNLDWNPGINMIYGSNAQGKTNLLEGIYFLSAFSSFRHCSKEEIIKKGADYFFISGEFAAGGINHTLKTAYSLKKKYVLKSDGNVIHRLSDMIGLLNTVVFSPDDLFMIKGNPDERRSFLDGEIIQMSPKSYVYFQKYQKILRQRNNILKEMREGKKNKEVLKAFDIQLAECGTYILFQRKEAIDRLLPLTRLCHRKITGGKEELILEYKGGLEVIDPILYKKADIKLWQEAYSEILKERLPMDIARGNTSFGPHRDDIIFYVNGDNVKKYGSQGQQRTATLALKIAELELMKGQRGEYPILLLDDVLSELDAKRREALIGVVNEKVQTFITGTKSQDFMGNCSSFYVENGLLKKDK